MEKKFWHSYKKQRRSIRRNYWNGRNNDYTTSNLLDNEYFSKHYKLIATDLSKPFELENPHLRKH